MTQRRAPGDLPDTGNEVQDTADFDKLQAKLVPLWKSIQWFNDDEQTIVVVASMSIDLPLQGLEQQAYEERFLFLLLLLRQPWARLVYVTSLPVQPELIDYYLQLLPGVIASHARRRLFFVSPCDSSPGPLSQKLLDRPRMIEQIRALIPDRDRAHLGSAIHYDSALASGGNASLVGRTWREIFP